MTVKELAAYLRGYEQACGRLDAERYTNTVCSVGKWPDVFGMNFEKLFGTPPEHLAEAFLTQERRGDLIRRLMRGEEVTSEQLRQSFGFSAEELAELRREQDPIRAQIPDNLCVLCFDDAMKSQYTTARPVLKQFGFNATFFITEMENGPRGPGFQDKTRYMTWDEISELERDGFELGNHSLHHVFGSQNMGREFNLKQIHGMEELLRKNGLRKPVSYAYPSGICNSEVLQCARDCGYKWARGNLEKGMDGLRGMTYYDPKLESPLAVCNFGDPDFYTEDLLLRRIHGAAPGKIFGMTYHDVGSDRWPGSCSFQRQMEILYRQNCKVISMRQLENYIDPEKAFQYTSELSI